MILKEDQSDVVVEVRAAFHKKFKRPLIVAPTGWGKGTVAVEMIRSAVSKGKRVLFIVNRRELVKDMCKRMREAGLPHGMLMGAQTHGSHQQVLVASKETLTNRLKDVGAPDLVFVDEAHMYVTDQCKELFDTLQSNGAYIIFMTATPWLLSRAGLNEIADCMIEGPQIPWLIEQGRLARPVMYAARQPDLSQVHVGSNGDYKEKELGNAMSDRRLMGDMVAHWKALGQGRPTVGFATNKKTAEEYAKTFREAGIRSIAVNDSTPDHDKRLRDGSVVTGRETVWQMLRMGQIDVVWSVGIIAYGWDVPEVSCIILARPTKSLTLHLQQIGRGLRYFPGKPNCIVLDHAGNICTVYGGGHSGLPDIERKWSLAGRTKKSDEKFDAFVMPQICPRCPELSRQVLKPGTRVCPVCQYEFARATPERQDIGVDESVTLKPITSIAYDYPKPTGDPGMDAQLSLAKAKNYNPGWLAHRGRALMEARMKYKERTGVSAKDHWTCGMINSMLKTSDEGQQWLAGSA